VNYAVQGDPLSSEGVITVLDHGYVKFVEAWGSDERIIEAARMSTSKGFLGWSCWKCTACGAELEERQRHTSQAGSLCRNEDVFSDGEFNRIPRDEKLLRFLHENRHATPFEMTGMTIEVQAPIFVFREWHRHRTQSYNEMSARYAPLPDVNYVPTVERLMINSKTNKQAGTVAGSDELTVESAGWFQKQLAEIYERDERVYQSALSFGVPKELARIHLPVGRYSRMMASTDLRNWLAFLTLRMAPNAQWEIRQFANAVGDLISRSFPRTWELFAESKP
jgi:thymidylate synthase (FAD)